MTLPTGARTVAVLEGARVSVAPRANGTMPSVSVTGNGGTLTGTLGADMTAYRECADGQDTCVAACAMGGEAAGLLRAAMGGSCTAQDLAAGEGQAVTPVEARPELFRSARGDVVTGLQGDAATWVCRWKPGQVYATTPLPTGGSVTTYAGPASLPTLRASARCAPNPTLVSP